MNMKINYWEDSRGCSPVEEFIEEIGRNGGRKAQEKVIRFIRVLGREGLDMLTKMPEYLKQLTLDGVALYELRVGFGGNAYRILFVVLDGIAYFLHAFSKKDQKTPPSEIAIALRRYELLKLELQII
jgi:phage-related protein